AVFLSSEDEAKGIKERLEAGEALGPIADEYSDYSVSREKHGELGYVMPEQTGETFDAYVFDPEVELGKWSEPLRDENYWSTGGYWLVEVVDREDDRKISSEDRNYLIEELFNEWASGLWADPDLVVDSSFLTEELNQWAIDRVSKDIQEAGG
ncbi:MAG: peptidylprolyl isomerase, partial [Dehalococcoidales bacterium]|nr:peptidylprolyl isomerase [Dehalococcoidales bacterium]